MRFTNKVATEYKDLEARVDALNAAHLALAKYALNYPLDAD